MSCRLIRQASGSDWYKGTANAIYQNISFIERYNPEYVIILSGDQICKQDYSDFLRFHKEKNAEFSVAVMEVPWEEASRFGLMVADENDRITEFQEKPKNPKSNLASMGIYIFNWDMLKKYLIEDEADPELRERLRQQHHPQPAEETDRSMYAYHFERLLEGRGNHLHLCGKPTWKFWIPSTAASTCLMRTGKSTAATAA